MQYNIRNFFHKAFHEQIQKFSSFYDLIKYIINFKNLVHTLICPFFFNQFLMEYSGQEELVPGKFTSHLAMKVDHTSC